MSHDVDQFRQVFNFKPKIVLLWPCSWLPVLIQKLRFASDLRDKKAVTRKQLSHNKKAASASLLRQSLFLNGRFCDLRLKRLEDWIYESIVRVCVCAASQGCHWCVLGKLEIGFVLCWLQACIAISLSTVEDPSCHHKKMTSIRNPFFLFDERAQRFCNFVNTVHDLNLHLKTQKSKKIGCGMDIKGSKPGSESQNMKKIWGVNLWWIQPRIHHKLRGLLSGLVSDF